jgi:hypothetical protein
MLGERSSRAFGASDYWGAAETELLERRDQGPSGGRPQKRRRRMDKDASMTVMNARTVYCGG